MLPLFQRLLRGRFHPHVLKMHIPLLEKHLPVRISLHHRRAGLLPPLRMNVRSTHFEANPLHPLLFTLYIGEDVTSALTYRRVFQPSAAICSPEIESTILRRLNMQVPRRISSLQKLYAEL